MSSNSGGYHDGGEPFVHNDFMTATGGPYYQSYPLQMFDRKLRPMSTVYVGLVATKRLLTDKYREMLLRQTDGITRTIPSEIESFYTFHFAYFSDNQAWTDNAGISAPTPSAFANSTAAEPATKKAKLHYEDAAVGGTYDPYTGMSQREWGGLVGAWKVGKVLDIAAQVKDRYRGGPVDTAERITVNVDIEFLDWRALRRALNVPEIGSRVPGAAPWLESLDYTQDWNQDKEVELKTRAARNPGGSDESALFDQGLVMQWPTAYSQVPLWDPGIQAGIDHFETTYKTIVSNMPTDPMTIDEAMRSGDGLVADYEDKDMTTRKTYLTRRAELGRAKLFKQKDDTPFLWIPKIRGVADKDQPEGAKERWEYEADVGGFTKPVFYDLTVDQRGFSQQGLSVPATSTASTASTAAEGRPPAVPPVPHEFDTLWSPNEHLDNWLSEVWRSKNYRLMGQNDKSFNGRGPAGLRQRVLSARLAHWDSQSNGEWDELTAQSYWDAISAHLKTTEFSQDAFIYNFMDTSVRRNWGSGVDAFDTKKPLPRRKDQLPLFAPYVKGGLNVNRWGVDQTLCKSVFRFIASLDPDGGGNITKKAFFAWVRPSDLKKELAAAAKNPDERSFLGAAGRDIELARDIAGPIQDAPMPDVVVPPASRAAAAAMATPSNGKGRATGASASTAAAAPPKAKAKPPAPKPPAPKPPAPKPAAAAAAPPKAAASVASVVMAPPGAASAPSATPTATAAAAVGSVSAAAPTRARRAVEASTDVFNSIFGATASTAASAVEDPAPSPSAQSDGSDGGAAGAAAAARGGRVRRAKDGR